MNAGVAARPAGRRFLRAATVTVADRPLAFWWAALAGAAVVVGLLAGRNPLLAIGLVVALTFVGFVIADVSMGFYLFTGVAFLEALPGVGGGLSFAKLAGLVLLMSWLATVAAGVRDRPSFVSDHPVATALALAFLGWTATSAVWAEAPRAVFGACFRYAPNLFLLPIAYTAIRSRRSAVVFATVFITTALISAIYGLAVPASQPGSGVSSERLGGAGVDPNILAMTLVGAVTVSVGLAAMRRNSPTLRAFAAISATLCTVAVFATVSRGGMLSLVVVLCAAAVLSGEGRRSGVIALAVAAVSSIVFYVLVLAPPYVRDRIVHSGGGAGRSDLWKIALRMVEHNPVVGVGAGNFPVSSVHYLLRPGTITRSDFIVDKPLVAHNIYLEIPAELGIVGLVLFLGIIWFALRCGIRASRRFAEAGDIDMEVLSRAIVLGAIGMLTANLFLSQQFNKPLWLLLAAGTALLAIASRERVQAT